MGEVFPLQKVRDTKKLANRNMRDLSCVRRVVVGLAVQQIREQSKRAVLKNQIMVEQPVGLEVDAATTTTGEEPNRRP